MTPKNPVLPPLDDPFHVNEDTQRLVIHDSQGEVAHVLPLAEAESMLTQFTAAVVHLRSVAKLKPCDPA